jgi:Spy/CpxP family protein refolding chaperone
MRELDLSPDQVRQVRRINQERRPIMEAAVTRLREASRSVDEAIYSDTLNEADVQVRMRELQTAQAEVARLRFTNELAVRKVLSPAQLVRFRDLRRQFAEQRQEFRNGRRGARRGLPLRRINRPAKPPSN